MSEPRRLKIAVVGTRGFPGVQGGVETHCRELYTRLAQAGVDVTVMCRRPFMPPHAPEEFGGVRLRSLWAPRSQKLEAIVHTLLGVVEAWSMGADVVHIHACGPALMAPLARLMGMKVVVTSHGHDYERAKWGAVARMALRLGERAGARWAHRLIAITPAIAERIGELTGRKNIDVIPNGVITLPQADVHGEIQERYGLQPGKYILAVGRLVPEKGFDLLIKAVAEGGLDGWRVVIAGGADHVTPYSEQLRRAAADAGVVMTGTLSRQDIDRLYSEASLFVMPSYHEGLPIALLEAMSHGRDVLVSDIEACRLPELSAADRFRCGDATHLRQRLLEKLGRGENRYRHYDLGRYDWDSIARATMAIYKELYYGSSS